MINTQTVIKIPNREHGAWICGREISRDYLAGECIHIEYENYRCPACGWTVGSIRWDVDGKLVDRYCTVCGADMLNYKGD